MSNSGIAILKTVIHDRANASADQPANADIVDSRTELHASVVRTSRHGVPNCAEEKAEQRESHEANFGSIEFMGRANKWEEADCPENQWD